MATARRINSLKLATLAVLAVGCITPAVAGTPGAFMSSAGIGRAGARLTYNGKTNSITSLTSVFQPCAAINPLPTYGCTTFLKTSDGTPSTAFCQCRGFPNYQWSIQTTSPLPSGVTADDPELEARYPLTAAPCASYKLESSAVLPDDNTAIITVQEYATAGAAIWIRVIEYTGDGVPEDLDQLKANGIIKYDYLATGPFDLGYTEACQATTIQVRSDLGHDHLYLVINAAAKTPPLTVACSDLTFTCGQTVSFPEPEITGGCGALTVTYDKAPGTIGFGTTAVTVTAMDESGQTAQCTFNVVRGGLSFTGFQAPISGEGGTCAIPIRSINKSSSIPVKFTVRCGETPVTTGTVGVDIWKYSTCPNKSFVGHGDAYFVSNVWQFIWSTSTLTTGKYELVVTLQDGSTHSADIQLTSFGASR